MAGIHHAVTEDVLPAAEVLVTGQDRRLTLMANDSMVFVKRGR